MKVSYFASGMLRQFRHMDPHKTGMITKTGLLALLGSYDAGLSDQIFDEVWELLDAVRTLCTLQPVSAECQTDKRVAGYND